MAIGKKLATTDVQWQRLRASWTLPSSCGEALENALGFLRMKRNIAEVDGNWEEAGNYGRAMAEIESLMDIA